MLRQLLSLILMGLLLIRSQFFILTQDIRQLYSCWFETCASSVKWPSSVAVSCPPHLRHHYFNSNLTTHNPPLLKNAFGQKDFVSDRNVAPARNNCLSPNSCLRCPVSPRIPSSCKPFFHDSSCLHLSPKTSLKMTAVLDCRYLNPGKWKY